MQEGSPGGEGVQSLSEGPASTEGNGSDNSGSQRGFGEQDELLSGVSSRGAGWKERNAGEHDIQDHRKGGPAAHLPDRRRTGV